MMVIAMLYLRCLKFTSQQRHPLQEGDEGHEALIVSGLAELLHQGLGLLLGQLLSEVGQQTESSWDSMVLSSFLSYSFRISTKSWKPPWSLESLQALYMRNTLALVSIFWPFSAVPPIGDGLEGGVQVAGADEVASVEGINLAISLEVIDIEGEVDG